MGPSSWTQRYIIAIIAAFATLVALYLGLYQWRVVAHVWDPVFGQGTENVLDSAVSHDIIQWIRIPDAFMGVFAYLADIIFSMAGSSNRWQDRPWLVIIFGISIIPVGLVSITLVLLQGFVVKSWCFLCLTSAALSLILIALSFGEVIACCKFLYEVKKISSWKKTWNVFWGYPCQEALEAGKKIYVGPNY